MRMLQSISHSLYRGRNYHVSKQFYSIGKVLYDDEPTPLVTTEPIFDPAKIKVPFFREQQRQDIYKKFKEDPITWSTAKLAEKYQASEMRIKAVVMLMQKREEMMTKNNVTDIPQEHQEIYEKSLVDGNTTTSIAEIHQKTEDEVKDVISRLKEHHHRLKNMTYMETYHEELMKEFSELGVKTDFQETPTTPEKSFATSYFPTLFGDKAFEEAKTSLLKRIEQETKAKLKPHPGIVFLKEKFGEHVAVADNIQLQAKVDEVINTQKFKTAPKLDGEIESRFKYAIRDISVPEILRKTVIRTRGGQFRSPTPVEELNRTWVHKPMQLDKHFFEEKMKQYRDPDGDEAKVVQHYENRNARRLALKAAKSS